jgi:hypothetical protein
VKSSEKINTPDIKIGIPSVLLCIEMAIFAILHLWAFAWQPYRIGHGGNSGGASSESGYPQNKESYQGGFLGLKAIGEAFNPWDLCKAIGRAARWMFVGRKTRTMDPSYQAPEGSSVSLKPRNIQADTSYGGAGGASGENMGRYRSDPYEEGEELLSHAQSNPMSSYSPDHSDIGLAISPGGSEFSSYHHEERQRLDRENPDTVPLTRPREDSYDQFDGSPPALRVMTSAYPQDLPHEQRMPSPVPVRYLPPSPDDPHQQKIGRFYET